MTDTSADLVTKIDVLPDLDGLNSFDAAIDKAIGKVNQLDAAIKRVNNLKPASPYAPSGTSSAPTAGTTAAITAIAATGANLISRTPLADTVRKEAQKVARAATQGIGNGVSNALPGTDRTFAGGGMALPAPSGKPAALPGPLPATIPTTALPGHGPTALPAPAPAPAALPATVRSLAGSGGGGIGIPPSLAGGAGMPPGPGGGNTAGVITEQDAAIGRLRDAIRGLDFDFGTPGRQGRDNSEDEEPSNENANDSREGGLSLETLAGAAGVLAGVKFAFDALANSLDSIQTQQSQIERLVQTTGDAKVAFLELNAAASDVRSDGSAFISTYTNMATATEKLGFSQERTIKATQGLVGALQLGGAGTEAKNAALYQMGQAFSSDRFGGDEFRSFMEAIGTQAPKVAEAFGTDVKGLRAMSTAGKLTAETMFKAFEKMADSNAELLKKQGWTWGQVTTVMGNDWQAFLARATIGGDWQKFTDWAANTLIPVVRGAESELAEFWSTLANESKTAILIGILGAVGAAFTALAIPVMAALWPFLAIGAAVWVVYEAFVEWKAWMNGEGGTIFESLFGSFDEFEKRYPSIIKGLKLLSELLGKSGGIAPESSVPSQSQLDDYQKDKPEKGLIQRFLEYNGNFNPMPGVEKFLGLFGSGPAPADVAPKASGAAGSVITNSGNTTTHIHVDSAKAAAETANNLSNPGEITDSVGGNIAESTGAL
ncbi:tape measure protein [Enterobacter kobei]|uniref:tape measure protein n=1 Tax=Enterobacter kobei TaxID=208224 RepID=UPI0011EC9EF3|nr:tape measure protein [Enterobacter kobei]QEO01402.1 tape measure protein [Enterobacter kobei]